MILYVLMMIMIAAKAKILNSYGLLKVFCCLALFTLAPLVLSGCAASSTTIIEEEVVTNSRPMYNYTSLLIRDFELRRDLCTSSTEALLNNLERRYSKLPAELTEHIERYIKSHHIYKQISHDAQADASTLVLTGKFTRISRFKISVAVSLRDGASNQEVAFFRQTLWDVLDTTQSLSDLGREIADFINRIQYK